MKTPLISTVSSLVAMLAMNSLSVAVDIDLSTATAAQSTQLGGFEASLALDDIVNFTHTLADDDNPTWQALLPEAQTFGEVTVFNRAASDGALDCCPSRLRDITIQILDFTGDVNADFTGGTVLYTSPLLNAENIIGGGTNTDGPISLSANPDVAGNMIRIIRTVDEDLSGTGGMGNADEGSVLSIDLVTANTVPEPSGMVLALFGLVLMGSFRQRK